ncbi:hypothetical protein FKW77_005505 [Venturia effusa]|uniref:mRNA N(6)-methyladenine demethylase n=1 Tax=Venturia effusa TaxID=50376 RepID=A0A517L9C6_9PEZI|nr:hypothetical protein FKW77_005505 [Venturia effusa]
MPHRDLDPHARPPEKIKDLYKRYQKLKGTALLRDTEVLDLQRDHASLTRVGQVRVEEQEKSFKAFSRGTKAVLANPARPVPIYAHEAMPGLRIIPGLLPPEIQLELLSHLVHRDVSNPAHQSNVHLHYNMAYPPNNASFFSVESPSTFLIPPKDASVHKPLNVSQFLNKKLRWITLGGQYDWTEKVYPEEPPPAFPSDISSLLRGLFPEMKPEAAIVNFYSPGDTLSLHRDVAEDCNRGLISISIGCDGIFILGLDDEKRPSVSESDAAMPSRTLAIRLRSGDAVYMDGESRFAWHGVPQIVPDTCPGWLEDWPAVDGEYEHWKGWMANKRINLNVRQMWDD